LRQKRESDQKKGGLDKWRKTADKERVGFDNTKKIIVLKEGRVREGSLKKNPKEECQGRMSCEKRGSGEKRRGTGRSLGPLIREAKNTKQSSEMEV